MNETRLLGLNKRAYNDLAVIALGAIIVFLFSAYYDLLEKGMVLVNRFHDAWQADEIVVVLVFLAFAFGAFSWRRWRELVHVIKEERQAKAALRTSEEKFSKAFRSSPNPITLSTFPEGQIIDVNEAGTRTSGYSRIELVGRKANELNVWSDPAAQAKFASLLNEDGVVHNYEFELRTKSGELRNCLVSAERIDIEGEQCLLSVTNDITERKQAEETLRATQEQLRTVVNNAPITIFATDQNGIFTLSEGKALERVGLRSGENVGVSAIDLYRSLPIVLQNGTVTTGEDVVRRVLSGETIFGGTELRGVHFDNQFVPMRDASEHVTGLVGVATDITERRKAEEESRLREERFRLQFHLIPTPAYMWQKMNDDLVLIDYNVAADSITEGQVKMLHGKSAREVYADMPDVLEDFVLCANEQKTIRREMFYRFRLIDRTKILSVTYVPLPLDLIVVYTEDITERKRSEEELRKFFQATEESPDNVIITNEDGIIEYVNTAFVELTGYDKQSAIGKTPRILKSGVHSTAFYENLWATIGKGDVLRSVLTNRKKNGELYFEEKTITPLRDQQGSVTHFVSTGRDITERKRAEEALKESEERYRSLLSHSVEAIYLYDEETKRVINANPAFLSLLGYSAEESQTLTAYDIVDQDRESIDGYSQQVLKSGGLFLQPRKWRCKNGTLIDVEVTISKIQQRGKTILYAIARDITERKRSEEAIRESEERYRDLVENINEVIFVVDANGVITYISPAAEILGGYKVSELIGKPFTSFIYDKDLALVQTAFNRTILGHLQPAEYRIKTVVGQTRWVRSSSKPIHSGSEIVGIRGALTDITERKIAEEEQKRSHEQLRALTSHLQLIREEERTRIAREIHDELGQVLTALNIDLAVLEKRLTRIAKRISVPLPIENVQSMSRLVESTVQAVRKLALELRPDVLDSLGLIAALEWQAQEFGTRTRVKCGLQFPSERLQIDQEREIVMFRIFQEALTNVARHANATKVDINLHVRENNVILTIQDNGRGIKENEIRGNRSLGLVGMRERALLYGGEVDIHGSAKNGTTLTVIIPLKKPNLPSEMNSE